jgi:hypothetical protein
MDVQGKEGQLSRLRSNALRFASTFCAVAA